MLDPTLAAPAVSPRTHYLGPERRHGPPAVARWLAQMLDEIDYGMLLLSHGEPAPADPWPATAGAQGAAGFGVPRDRMEVVHCNHAAQMALTDEHPLQLQGRQLRAREPQDAQRLAEALASAGARGLRRLLIVGRGAQRASVAVVPLGGGASLVVLGRRRLSQRISMQYFALQHALTNAETRVLESLCEGLDPREIAQLNDVGLATVRTQIGHIRAKTGTPHIRELVRQVAVLPPMMGALRS